MEWYQYERLAAFLNENCANLGFVEMVNLYRYASSYHRDTSPAPLRLREPQAPGVQGEVVLRKKNVDSLPGTFRFLGIA